MQALIQLLPGCSLAHMGGGCTMNPMNVSHGATLFHTEMGPKAWRKGEQNCVTNSNPLFGWLGWISPVDFDADYEDFIPVIKWTKA